MHPWAPCSAADDYQGTHEARAGCCQRRAISERGSATAADHDAPPPAAQQRQSAGGRLGGIGHRFEHAQSTIRRRDLYQGQPCRRA
jgi:hypothetical protein